MCCVILLEICGFISQAARCQNGSLTGVQRKTFLYVYNGGPPNDSVQLVYNLVNSMVYGGYNELVHGFINQQT